MTKVAVAAGLYGAYESRKARKDQASFNQAQQASAARVVEQAEASRQQEVDAALAADKEDQRKRRESGRASTFKTGAAGLRVGAPTIRKTLLGE